MDVAHLDAMLHGLKKPSAKNPLPAKEPSKEQLLCPDNTVNRLVRCVANGAYWICLCA